MLLTTTGRTFVYGVFIGDGAECCDLHSLYEDEETAARMAENLQQTTDWIGSPVAMYGSLGYIEVRSLEIHRGCHLIRKSAKDY